MCLYTIHIYTLLHTEGNLSSSQIAASISCAEEICTESIDALLQLTKWQMQKKTKPNNHTQLFTLPPQDCWNSAGSIAEQQRNTWQTMQNETL